MSSSYSPDLRIELIANGEQSGTWGTTTNYNLGTLIEEAIAKTATPTLTLTAPWFVATNGVSDTARCAAVDVSVDGSITNDFTAYIPPVPKLYVIKNSSGYEMTLRNATAVNSDTSAGGVTVVIPDGKTVIVRSDGTDCYSQFDYLPNNLEINGNLVMSGNLTTDGNLVVDGSTTLSGGLIAGGARLSATYSQGSGNTTATFSTSNTYVGGVTQVYIGTVSGEFPSGIYTVATASPSNFTVTATAPAGAISGSAFVTDDVITINGVVPAGVVIDGSTTIPALRVTQTGTGAAILVDDSTNPDTSPFIVDAGGNVGIGTTAPAQLLDLTSNSTAISQLSRYSSDASGAANLIRKSRGTLASPTIVSSGDSVGTVAFQAYDGAAFQPVAQISAIVDGTPGAGDMPGKLAISTTPNGSGTLVDRMIFTNDGLVGVGVTPSGTAVVGDPSTLLSIKAGTTAIAPLGFASGTPLTNPLAGAVEYDGVVLSFTNDATSKRGFIGASQIFRLTAAGSAIGPSIADFFGANSALNVVAGGVYEIEFNCFFTKNTAGTVTWTVTSSQAPVNVTGTVDYGAAAGGTATGAANQIAIFTSTSTAAAFGATASLSNVNFVQRIKILYEANASLAGTVKLQITQSAGTVIPLRGSYYKVTRLPSGNSGSFA